MTFYCDEDFKSKKALKDAIKEGKQIQVYSAGLGTPKTDGEESVCGPWYPQPHTWYARVLMEHGRIKKVIA